MRPAAYPPTLQRRADGLLGARVNVPGCFTGHNRARLRQYMTCVCKLAAIALTGTTAEGHGRNFLLTAQ